MDPAFCVIFLLWNVAGQNWGQADNLRYDCCFICVDASLSSLDEYVNRRVDLMVSTGLLEEVREIYKPNSDYTRGLRQAIGVREFEDFLRYSNSECHEMFKENMKLNATLEEAIEKMKLNTRRLVRRQVRELSRLICIISIHVTSDFPFNKS